MPFNIVRFFLDFMLESYAIAVFLLWLYLRCFPNKIIRKEGVWNNLNLIGLSLGALVLFDEVNTLLEDPGGNNYKIHWQDQPYWHEFRVISIIVFSLAVFVLLSKKRRKYLPWNVIATVLFLLDKASQPVESWMTSNFYGRSYPISFHLMLFSAHAWWLGWIFVAVFLGSAYYLAYRLRD